MIVRSNKKYTDALYDALLKLKTKEEIASLFEDLCTLNEVHAMGQRLEVARLLSENIPYNETIQVIEQHIRLVHIHCRSTYILPYC